MRVTGSIGFSVVEQSPERVVGAMPIQPGMLNPFGVVHAGAMLWFADVCATVLAAGGSGFPLAINLNAAFVGNQKAMASVR